MIGRRKFIVLVSTGGVAVTATIVAAVVLPGERRRSGPPVLRYGDERCAYCGMNIDDPRFASAWRGAGGAEAHFDDIGCMVNAARRHDPGPGAAWWVHDYQARTWLDAGSSAYVIAEVVKTPMDYRVAAFAEPGTAQLLTQQGGKEYTWTTLLQNLERKG